MEYLVVFLLATVPFEPGPWESAPGNDTFDGPESLEQEVYWGWNPGPISWDANGIPSNLLMLNHKISGDQFPNPNLDPQPPWTGAYTQFDPNHEVQYWTAAAALGSWVDPGYSYQRLVGYNRHTGTQGFYREWAASLFQHVTRHRDEATDMETIHRIQFFVDPDDRGG